MTGDVLKGCAGWVSGILCFAGSFDLTLDFAGPDPDISLKEGLPDSAPVLLFPFPDPGKLVFDDGSCSLQVPTYSLE